MSFNRRWRKSDGSVSMQLQYPVAAVRQEEELPAAPQPVDDGLAILRFRAAAAVDGAAAPLLAALINFGMHPVTGGRHTSGWAPEPVAGFHSTGAFDPPWPSPSPREFPWTRTNRAAAAQVCGPLPRFG